jgi:hypothetical protein
LPQAATQAFGRGVQVQGCDAALGCSVAIRGALALSDSLIVDSHEGGLVAVVADAIVERTLVRDSKPRAQDGVFGGDGLAFLQSAATVRQSLASDSARAGLSSFGADVALGSTLLRCSAFPLASEHYEGAASTIEDLGNNGCGCPDADETCTAISASLEPPTALGAP